MLWWLVLQGMGKCKNSPRQEMIQKHRRGDWVYYHKHAECMQEDRRTWRVGGWGWGGGGGAQDMVMNYMYDGTETVNWQTWNRRRETDWDYIERGFGIGWRILINFWAELGRRGGRKGLCLGVGFCVGFYRCWNSEHDMGHSFTQFNNYERQKRRFQEQMQGWGRALRGKVDELTGFILIEGLLSYGDKYSRF